MSTSNPLKPQVVPPRSMVHRVGHGAATAGRQPWVGGFFRLGYVVRGVIYLIPGVLALELAFGAHRGALTQTGAIALIGQQPLGRLLLLVVAAGLAGYALWGVFRAVFDPLQQGHSPRGLAKRFGYLTSTLAYAGLLAATVHFLRGALPNSATQPDWSAALLASPMGVWLVGIIGVFWVAGAGIGEIVRGWRGSFEKELAFERMSGGERRWAVRLGRFGTVARGVVFTIVGLLLVAAALHPSSHPTSGLDGALRELARQPFGRALLVSAALGLIAFGAFSVMCARWMRMGVRPHTEHSPAPHPVTV